jgi:hypothetical protein
MKMIFTFRKAAPSAVRRRSVPFFLQVAGLHPDNVDSLSQPGIFELMGYDVGEAMRLMKQAMCHQGNWRDGGLSEHDNHCPQDAAA